MSPVLKTRVLMREIHLEFLSALRQPAFTLPTLLFPTMFYILFGLVFSTSSAVHVPSWMLATYGVFGIMGPALFGFGVGIALDRAEGWLRLKRAAPVSPLVPLLARMVMAMLFAFIVFVLLALLGAIFGDVKMLRSDWILLAVVLTVGSIPFSAMGLAAGLCLNPRAAPMVINLIFLPMAVLSGLWMPLMMFPVWLRAFAPALPPYHLAAIALDVVGQQEASNLLLHVVVLVAYTGLFLIIAAVAWRTQEK